jgi:hypothetical protein
MEIAYLLCQTIPKINSPQKHKKGRRLESYEAGKLGG